VKKDQEAGQLEELQVGAASKRIQVGEQRREKRWLWQLE
jgi:hypothetical protein